MPKRFVPSRCAAGYKGQPSLYIHIPFCRKKCLYCDFYSIAYNESLAGAYIEALSKQTKKLESAFSSVYIGGGTPTVLKARVLARLLGSLKKNIRPDTEFTVEANPESLDKEKLDLFWDSGVNRLSLGVQSLRDEKLEKLGRLHNSMAALQAVEAAARAGFKNISIDLIFGVWGERLSEWEGDLERGVSLPIKHISCYGLTYEEDTPIYVRLKSRSINPLDDSLAARMYELAIGYLSTSGFRQYEVSNFARDGYSCRHNLNYWDNNPYIGLGASAVSYVNGIRSENTGSVEEYILRAKKNDIFSEQKNLKSSPNSIILFKERLSAQARAKETAALKIRTAAGIDFQWFKKKTGFDFLELESPALARLLKDGLIKYKGHNSGITGVCLRRKGFLFSDSVSGAFL